VYNLPFKGSPAMPVVSVTRLHLASLWFFLAFLAHALRSSRQARRSPGFITGWGNDSEWGFWTATVWESAEAMRAYRSGQHLKAMPKLLRWCDEGAFVHWEQQEDSRLVRRRRTSDCCATGRCRRWTRRQRGSKLGQRWEPWCRVRGSN
jgi:hypothetical protein